MHRFEHVDLLFGFGRQIVVGAVHVDVLRITAVGRERNREQRGRFRRPGMVRVIGVKRLAGDDSPAVHELVVGNIRNVRVARHMMFFPIVRLEFAE
jgi:hypothetical protein